MKKKKSSLDWKQKKIDLQINWGGSLKETVKSVELSLIQLALEEFKTKTQAAAALGVNRMTIIRKLKEKI